MEKRREVDISTTSFCLALPLLPLLQYQSPILTLSSLSFSHLFYLTTGILDSYKEIQKQFMRIEKNVIAHKYPFVLATIESIDI